jgi:Rieske Fe-S protein
VVALSPVGLRVNRAQLFRGRFAPRRGGEHLALMARCEVCGNDYDKAFEVRIEGSTHTFDSFECAIHALAPTCAHCGCRIIGHGVEANGRIFCCAHCADQEGVAGLRDRA